MPDIFHLDSRNPIYQREEQFEPWFENYRDFRITEEQSEWAKKYGSNWCVGEGDCLREFATIQEARDYIDDIYAREENQIQL